jgi:hypothetical protein
MTMWKVLGLGVLMSTALGAQPARPASPVSPAAVEAAPVAGFDQPDAHRTHEELNRLLERYPPTLKNVLALDHSLLSNQAFLAPYPALQNFLSAHPEIVRDPAFYVGSSYSFHDSRDNSTPSERISTRLIENLTIFSGFALAGGVLAWLIRTLIDYRRWNRLTKVQTDVHTKILDRFSGSEELLAYIKSPAGSDAGPRSIGAPLGRILWSVQAGLVLVAGGIGLDFVSGRIPDEAAQPIHAIGILGIALGCGFVVSAAVSYFISQRLGLIEPPVQARPEPPGALG